MVVSVHFLLQGAYFVLLSQHEKPRITIFNVDEETEPRVSEVLDFEASSIFTFDPNTEDFFLHSSKEIHRVHFDLESISIEKLNIELGED